MPSRGLHAYGQTYAIDLVHEPDDRARPAFGWWPPFQPPQNFPAFGQPVLAPSDGVVVRTHDRERDHWSRNSWPSLLYLFVEGAAREALGPGRILGNHVVLELGDGVYGRSPTCATDRSRSAEGNPSWPVSRSPSAGAPATPPSRICTSS